MLLAEVYPIISLVVFHLPAVCRLCVFCLLCFFVFVCLFVFPSSLAPVVAWKRRSGAPRTQKLRFIPMRFRAFDRFRVVFFNSGLSRESIDVRVLPSVTNCA